MKNKKQIKKKVPEWEKEIREKAREYVKDKEKARRKVEIIEQELKKLPEEEGVGCFEIYKQPLPDKKIAEMSVYIRNPKTESSTTMTVRDWKYDEISDIVSEIKKSILFTHTLFP